MVLVHGYAEHCGRYDEMAMHFAGRGFSVHSYDQAGHGRTPGPRGHVKRFDSMLDDLARFIEIVRLEEAGRPLTLVGHSMGGLVVAATSAFRNPDVDEIVISAAALELGEDISKASLWMAKLFAPFGSRVGMSVGLNADGLSRDPEVVKRYIEDPLVEDRMSASFASGMMATIEKTSGAAAQIEKPILILHGGDDPICPSTGSQAFFDRLKPGIAERSALKIYPGLRHEIFNEPEREEVWGDMLDWLGASETIDAERAG